MNTMIRCGLGAIVWVGLCLTTRVNYLLFHGIVEIFSIVVACAFFMIAWNSRSYKFPNVVSGDEK